MDYSKSELAQICGVSTQAIDKRLNASGLRAKCRKVSNRLLIPETVATEITTYYGVELKPSLKPDGTSTTKFETDETDKPKPDYVPMTVYEDLRKQLEIKDKQIADLSTALVAAQESLKAEQVLHATAKREALAAGGHEDHDEDRQEPGSQNAEQEGKKGIWQRIKEAFS